MEKVIKPMSGWLALFIALALLVLGAFLVLNRFFIPGALCILVACFLLPGLITVQPNTGKILTFFGNYSGTVRDSGLFFVNPFYTKQRVSLRADTLDIPTLKVNDKQGNPIMIGAVVVYRVADSFKAVFEVERYNQFVKIQSESAVRKLAGLYSYDNWEDEGATATLRTSSDEVNNQLAHEIRERLAIAGIEVIEARINNLAYATEIAGAMLQRQQATAIVAARSKIVEGAVGMVEMALEQLSKKQIVTLDEDKKAAMVSNLMVVLCGERGTTPVINAGTLHQG